MFVDQSVQLFKLGSFYATIKVHILTMKGLFVLIVLLNASDFELANNYKELSESSIDSIND